MFPSEYLDEMTSEFFSGDSQEVWTVAENEKAGIVAVSFCSPERMTEGTWNLLMIAVLPDYQGVGIGKAMMEHAESQVNGQGARVLLVETSGLPEYEKTREFYPKCGYEQVAVIPDYYDAGDDKVVFWKSLED
ncbi:GNAT family N-acetyltransferase [Vibrio maritimus]|uniref:GNAT family N-acetyltransferase n=1 Tax=Vibrio maritimus TaxID=990268 RepID=UPI004068A583